MSESRTMIESVQFHNYKVLRDTTLPLSRFTLIVGPNGSGKTTAVRAIRVAADAPSTSHSSVQSANPIGDPMVEVVLCWSAADRHVRTCGRWIDAPNYWTRFFDSSGSLLNENSVLEKCLKRYQIYVLEADAIALPVALQRDMEIAPNGTNLAGVIDGLRDKDPERFEALNEELGRWFPEFDRVLFDTTSSGRRIFMLRTREGRHQIPAPELSQGTLLALTMLTLAYLPEPPSIVCFEDPDRGIHPRLLTNIQDALYRLAYPEDHGESREPVQVIATTHSPYFLNLFKDHPEEIVIAEKAGPEAKFHRLADRPDLDEVLEGGSLGDIWYTGILGGVPASP